MPPKAQAQGEEKKKKTTPSTKEQTIGKKPAHGGAKGPKKNGKGDKGKGKAKQ